MIWNERKPSTSKLYYGWPIVGIGFLIYGLGIAPAYYSWGFFAPEIIHELKITRQDIGEIFGTFTLTLALTSALSAMVIKRWGLRLSVTIGALIASIGWYFVGKASSLTELYISYALIGGVGLGLSTLIPAQTLAVFWFKKYRARATAVIFFGAAVCGAIITPIDAIILEHADWRTAWIYIAGISIFISAIAAVFLRNRPEEIGQNVDGEAPERDDQLALRGMQKSEEQNLIGKFLNVRQAIFTPQFLIATFADIANAVPWRVITAHGRLHLENLGFAPTLAAAILGVRVGMSGFGRLSGAISDFLPPTLVMALSLGLTAIGVGGISFVQTSTGAYVCVLLMGIGYGGAFTTIPVVFGSFFGRESFVSTAGLRVAITGVIGFFGASWAGAVADETGSYTPVLLTLSTLCVLAAILIFFCPSFSRERA